MNTSRVGLVACNASMSLSINIPKLRPAAGVTFANTPLDTGSMISVRSKPVQSSAGSRTKHHPALKQTSAGHFVQTPGPVDTPFTYVSQ